MNSKKTETASTLPNSQADIENTIKSLSLQINQNSFQKSNYYKYISRSQMFTIAKDYQSAIIDLSKSLFIQPTYSAYVQRGKLLVGNQQYVDALSDFEEAKRIYRKDNKQGQKVDHVRVYLGEEYENWDITKPIIVPKLPNPEVVQGQIKEFLNSSTLMLNLGEIKGIAEEHQKIREFMSKEYNIGMSNAFTRLIDQKVDKKVNEKVKQIESNLMKQLLNIRQQFEGEIDKVKKQYENYYFIFKQEIDNATLSQRNKQKLNAYFDCVVLELEKFYLSAEILSKYEEKISFEDCQGKIKQREHYRVGFIEKIYKMFEKNSEKIEKAGEIVKEIPYIGTMFKVIKNTLHCLGWINDIKNESECKNIMKIRPCLQQFNKLSYIIGYELYKYFKIDIVSDLNVNRYKKNIWSKTSDLVTKYKTKQVVNKIYPHVQYQDQGIIQEMGKIHVAIFMATIAYGIFQMPAYGQVSGFNWGQIMDVIRDVESNFIQNKENDKGGQETEGKEEGKQEKSEQLVKNQKQLQKESKCEIF